MTRPRRGWTVLAAVVVLLAVGFIGVRWWRSPGQRLDRAVGDLADLPGVSRATTVRGTDVRVMLTHDASVGQARMVLVRGQQLARQGRDRAVDVVAGAASMQLQDDASFSLSSVADEQRERARELLGLRGLRGGTASLTGGGSLRLDASGTSHLAHHDLAVRATRLLADAGARLPDSVRDTDTSFVDVGLDPDDLADVLELLRPVVSGGWWVRRIDDGPRPGNELTMYAPTGTADADLRAGVRDAARRLGEVRDDGAPVISTVLVLSPDDGVASASIR